MNYFILLARLFLVAYSAFMLLFAFREGITGDGLMHVFPPLLIVLVLVFLWNKFVWSAAATIVLFGVSVWFFETYNQLVPFLIISFPLFVASVLFLLGAGKNSNLNV